MKFEYSWLQSILNTRQYFEIERRYVNFDRWWKDRNVTDGEENKEKRKFASLT